MTKTSNSTSDKYPLQVLMPCYNAALYLSEALDSLINQTEKHWQLLIIDDGSTDNSLELIKHYASEDPRIKFRTRENQGLIRTLNELVEWSTAPLLARMDADDISTIDRFEKQLAFMQRYPDVDMVGCWAELFGNKQEVWHFRESDNNTRVLSLFGHCCMLHASVIAKRVVFENVPFNVDYQHVEDFIFLSDIIAKTNFKFGNVRQILYRYRMHPDSIVQQYQTFRENRYKHTVLRHLQAIGLDLEETDYQAYWHFIEGNEATYRELLIMGRLLASIRKQLEHKMPDEHHEIALRWLKYCVANGHPELYFLCRADNLCFLQQKNQTSLLVPTTPTDICSLADLNDSPWVILGSGGYVKLIIEKCVQLGIRLPEYMLTSLPNSEVNFLGVPSIDEQNYNFALNHTLVFGSNVHQMSMLSRIAHRLHDEQVIYDCSSAMWSTKNSTYFNTEIDTHSDVKFVIIFDINPAEHIDSWLSHFVQSLVENDVQILIRHPLQVVSDNLLVKASHVFIWNGATAIFDCLKMRLAQLDVNFDFLECGFFPQKKYFYIDSQGINNQRELAQSKLQWVDEDIHRQRLALRAEFFSEYPSNVSGDFIFVPLQLANDSNVQRNSRFTDGMQAFIDFIEDLYPNEKIIVKKHPKDPEQYTSKRAEFSTEDSRLLISLAKHVHGINSTVLFEAALAGKSVSAEGECLLNHKYADKDTVVAAIIATQYPVHGPFGDVISNLAMKNMQNTKVNFQGVYE